MIDMYQGVRIGDRVIITHPRTIDELRGCGLKPEGIVKGIDPGRWAGQKSKAFEVEVSKGRLTLYFSKNEIVWDGIEPTFHLKEQP